MATVKQVLSGKSPVTDTSTEKMPTGAGKGLMFERFFTD
jgi:hypothetical protein